MSEQIFLGIVGRVAYFALGAVVTYFLVVTGVL